MYRVCIMQKSGCTKDGFGGRSNKKRKIFLRKAGVKNTGLNAFPVLFLMNRNIVGNSFGNQYHITGYFVYCFGRGAGIVVVMVCNVLVIICYKFNQQFCNGIYIVQEYKTRAGGIVGEVIHINTDIQYMERHVKNN